MLGLYREPDRPMFDDADKRFRHAISTHLADGARRALTAGEAADRDPAHDETPGLVILSDQWEVASATPGVVRRLAELPDSSPHAGTLPSAVIIEPAHPARIYALLTPACQFTERGCDVTEFVLRGASTKEVTKRLLLSPHTGQQHLKHIFDKTGAHSRRDLVGNIFFAHFEPRFRDDEQRVQPGAPILGGPAGVKRTRRYDSPRRREHAASTRRHILDTALRLFDLHGYAATSMAAIARESGVVSKTVNLAFEGKGGLLRGLRQPALGDVDDQAPAVAREGYQEMIDEPDPERMLRLNARDSRAAKERAGTVMAVIAAAAEDDDARQLWELIQSDFHKNQGAIVRVLARRKLLRQGITVARAVDVMWTINHPDVWQLLTVGRRWTPAQYEKWTAQAAGSQLLGSAL